MSYYSVFPAIPVSRVVVHQNYGFIDGIPVNDIAILVLNDEISKVYNVEYARLPTYEFDGDFSVSVYGWGNVAEGGPASNYLLETTMDTMITSDCVRMWFPGCRSIEKCKIICAISVFNGSGAGDSGGPVVLHDGTVVGIVMSKIFTNTSMDEEELWQQRIFLRTFSYKKFIDFRELRHPQKLYNIVDI